MEHLVWGFRLQDQSRGILEPSPVNSLSQDFQVFLLLFFDLNWELCLALCLSKASEPPSLWRRRSLLETEGFILYDLKRNSLRSPPSGPNLQTLQQLVVESPAVEGLLTINLLLATRQERGPLFSAIPSPLYQQLHFSQCCPATVPFTHSPQTHHFTSLATLLALE